MPEIVLAGNKTDLHESKREVTETQGEEVRYLILWQYYMDYKSQNTLGFIVHFKKFPYISRMPNQVL